MNTYAICRDYEEGESFPLLIQKTFMDQTKDDYIYVPCSDKLYECWQPDCIEDDEFNLVLMIDGKPYLARGFHFDFIDK